MKRRGFAGALSVVFLLGLMALPAQAAEDTQGPEKEAFLAEMQEFADGRNYLDLALPVAGADQFPASYDLRNVDGKNYVPEVEDQSPWGTCWAFAACAASEISILSELNMSPEEFANANDGEEMNLSEKHLAWFAATPLPEDDSQPGEGVHLADATTAGKYSNGGLSSYAVSAFASGVGAVREAEYPYGNSEGERVETGDWSLPESERFVQSVELEHANRLPGTWAMGTDGEYGYDFDAMDIMKSELLSGRAIELYVYFPDEGEKYENEETRAYYVDLLTDKTVSNHAVTVVGWDDNYAVSNFNPACQPEKPGAWLVRNSWGSDWGLDGYFWLSYYDQSIDSPASFDFVTNGGRVFTETSMDIQEYDLMPVEYVAIGAVKGDCCTANVFSVSEGYVMKYLSVMTGLQNTTVTASLYLLRDDSKSPEDGILLDTLEDTFDYAGYHRLPLTKNLVLPEGADIGVVVRQKVAFEDGTYSVITAPVGFSRESSEDNYQKAVINPGESFVKFDGVWEDWKDTVRDVKDTCEGAEYYSFDNQAIKLYGYALDELQELHNFVADGDTCTCTDDDCGFSYLVYVAAAVAESLFSDVHSSDYFFDSVNWASENGVTGGTSATTFSPNANTTRGQMVTFLWRAAGSPEPTTTENPFTDVNVDSYYGKAVLWSVENGITNGMTATTFAPDATVTRGQAVTFLYRALGDAPVAGQANPFADVSNGDYFYDAVLWAKQKGITGGTSATTFSPKAPCTRGQIVTFLHREAN